MRLDWHSTVLSATISGVCLLVACGGGTISYRHVDTPAAETRQYGAPQQTQYVLEFEPQKELLGITIYEHSVCESIRVQVVNRTRETLEDDRVIHEAQLGKVQVASEVDGKVACEQRFAREAQVSLKVGEAVYPIGTTSADGHVGVNLAKRLDADVYGAPKENLIVMIRPQGEVAMREVGRVPLGELQAREKRIDELVTELSRILAKPPESMTPDEITRSYQLYAQLRSIAWYDSRFQGLQLRFWEVWENRKDIEATENLSRNLQALEQSKELLRTASAATIPLFAQIGINSGLVSDRMLEWARWELLEGIHQHPEFCRQGPNWAGMPDYLSVSQQIAGGYMHFVYGDPFEGVFGDMCRRAHGPR
jgi:hypothetical protein